MGKGSLVMSPPLGEDVELGFTRDTRRALGAILDTLSHYTPALGESEFLQKFHILARSPRTSF